MPKAKLTFPVNEETKFRVAAEIAGIKTYKSIQVGEDTHLEISYKDPQSLLKMGRLIDKVTGKELDPPKSKKK